MPRPIPQAAQRAVALDPYWPAQIAVLAALLLYLALPHKLTLGPDWLVPSSEAVLLVALVIMTPRGRPLTPLRGRRIVAITLVLIAAGTNIASLVQLIEFIVTETKLGGYRLVLSGIEIWATNVLIFAVAYWELDAGGPERRRRRLTRTESDLLFQQMAIDGFPPDWRPEFADYLYTSFTNCTAFSPTDTMPLTARMKLLMLVQATAALATLGIVVARAIGLLD